MSELQLSRYILESIIEKIKQKTSALGVGICREKQITTFDPEHRRTEYVEIYCFDGTVPRGDRLFIVSPGDNHGFQVTIVESKPHAITIRIPQSDDPKVVLAVYKKINNLLELTRKLVEVIRQHG